MLKRFWSLLKASCKLTRFPLKGTLRCSWYLLKAIPRLVSLAFKGTIALLVFCILALVLFNLASELPGPGVRSIQVKKNLPRLTPSSTYDASRSVVKLYNPNGDFFCSGVVIGGNYVLTAAHCLVDENGLMRDEDVTVVNIDGSVSVRARPVGVSLRMDHGLIQGDFSKIPGAKLVYAYLEVPPAVLACGYPLGTLIMSCTTLAPRLNDAFFIKCDGGPLLPGQSGGPVFNKHLEVIGLNVRVYGAEEHGGVAYTPVVGILGEFKIGN